MSEPTDAATAGVGSPRVYDAFISYSHAQDRLIADALQREMQRFGVPWYRHRPLPPGSPAQVGSLRPLLVFRDITNLAATPGLWPDIERALGMSEWFILMASPAAARSPWVRKKSPGGWRTGRPNGS
jgi:hypothetical protein